MMLNKSTIFDIYTISGHPKDVAAQGWLLGQGFSLPDSVSVS